MEQIPAEDDDDDDDAAVRIGRGTRGCRPVAVVVSRVLLLLLLSGGTGSGTGTVAFFGLDSG